MTLRNASGNLPATHETSGNEAAKGECEVLHSPPPSSTVLVSMSMLSPFCLHTFILLHKSTNTTSVSSSAAQSRRRRRCRYRDWRERWAWQEPFIHRHVPLREAAEDCYHLRPRRSAPRLSRYSKRKNHAQHRERQAIQPDQDKQRNQPHRRKEPGLVVNGFLLNFPPFHERIDQQF